MKTTYLFIASILLTFYACNTNEPSEEETGKSTVEFLHPVDEEPQLDEPWINEGDTVHYHLSLQHRPQYFVMETVETDSIIEAHYYEDRSIVFYRNTDSIIINKDSLLAFVNKEYLNEALIENLHLKIYEPKINYAYFEFSVRKPKEQDRFNFQATVFNNELKLNISDE